MTLRPGVRSLTGPRSGLSMSEVRGERKLTSAALPTVLVMLPASHKTSGFSYPWRLPTTGMRITKPEDRLSHSDALEVPGSLPGWRVVSLNSQQDLQEWPDHVQKTTEAAPSVKAHSVLSYTLSSHSITPSSKPADSKSGCPRLPTTCCPTSSTRALHTPVSTGPPAPSLQ